MVHKCCRHARSEARARALRARAIPGTISDTPERNSDREAIEEYPDRCLFEADVVAPKSIGTAMACNMGAPLWKALSPETVRKLALENYERSFDDGRRELRLAGEHQNLGAQALQ